MLFRSAEEKRQKEERLAGVGEREFADRTQRYLGRQSLAEQVTLTLWSAVLCPGRADGKGLADLGRARTPLLAGREGKRTAGSEEEDRERVCSSCISVKPLRKLG